MSSPIIWGPSGSKFIGTPQGANGTVLTNDGTGNLSWVPAGGSTSTNFPINNDQSSFSDITGFLIDPGTYQAFTSELFITRTFTDAYTPNVPDDAFNDAVASQFNTTVDAIVTQSDGKMVISGDFTTFNGNTRNRIVRLNADGTEDTAFYSNLGTAFNDRVRTLWIQANGQILAGGIFTSVNGTTYNSLIRLNSDGTIDTTFGTNIGTGFNNGVFSVVEQTDTAILVAGNFSTFNGNTRNSLVRLNADGTEDTAFYTNLGTGFGGTIFSVVFQPDTKILIGGSFTSLNGNTRNRLDRLNSDGTEDSTFVSNFSAGFNNTVLTIALQPDTKILVGGQFTDLNGSTRNRLVRFNSDGTQDSAFYTSLGSGFNDEVRTVAVEHFTNKIYAGGLFSTLNGIIKPKIYKMNLDGTQDLSSTPYIGAGAVNPINWIDCSDFGVGLGGEFTTFNDIPHQRFLKLATVTDLQLFSQSTVKGFFDGTSWMIGETASILGATDPGVSLNMTNAGQMQYESSNILGTVVVSQLTFLITGLL